MAANKSSFTAKYFAGEIINGILFIERLEKCSGKFECPFCHSIFTCKIYHVVNGAQASCGCRYMGKPRHYHTTNDGYRSPEYRSWSSMMRRCSEKATPYRKSIYFDKGVVVCERWKDFANFLADMGNRPSPKHTLDRFPNNKGIYEPGNVRWATQKEQSNNLTTNVIVTYKGETKTLPQWCEQIGLNYFAVRERLIAGWCPEKAFETPIRKRGPAKIVWYKGTIMTMREACKLSNIEFEKVRSYIRVRGVSDQEAFDYFRFGKRNFISHSFGVIAA